MTLIARDFYGKYSEDQYIELADACRTMAHFTLPYGIDNEQICEFVRNNWVEKSNIVTALSFCQQSVRFVSFINDMPAKFVRPYLTLEYLAEEFGFVINRKNKQTFANYAEALTSVSMQLRGVIADLNGDSL